MYFLDTNICIYLINAKYPRLNERYLTCDRREIKIPSVVLFELCYGVEKSQNRPQNLTRLNDFIGGIEIVPLATRAAEIAGNIRADLERNGQIIGGNDLLIAATVIAHHGIIVTNNVREFSRIKNLVIDDWSSR